MGSRRDRRGRGAAGAGATAPAARGRTGCRRRRSRPATRRRRRSRRPDWAQILALYGALVRINPGPVVRLNRAIALEHVAGPVPAMEEIDALRADLDGYHLYWATRAELLRRFGRLDEAADADRRPSRLTDNPSERALLETRLEPTDIRAIGANKQLTSQEARHGEILLNYHGGGMPRVRKRRRSDGRLGRLVRDPRIRARRRLAIRLAGQDDCR